MNRSSILPGRYIARALLTAFSLTSSGVAGAAAQESDHQGWLVGGSIGMPATERGLLPELFTIGGHWTQFRPGQLGVDLSLGTMPRLLLDGLLPVGARADVALPVAASTAVYLMPSAGVSLLGGFSSTGMVGDIGLNVGMAAAIMGSTGLRAGATWHQFGGGGVWLLEVGFIRTQ